jgi:hypothetical protein
VNGAIVGKVKKKNFFKAMLEWFPSSSPAQVLHQPLEWEGKYNSGSLEARRCCKQLHMKSFSLYCH